MKFTIEQTCNCGGRFVFAAYGDGKFGGAACAACGKSGFLIDPLSVSVTAERLLYRSRQELENGEYSLAIVIAVMAVESYLTRLFLKLKGMDSYATTFQLPTAPQEAQWEKEYPRSGGFSRPVGFVSQELAGASFDKFIAGNAAAGTIFCALPSAHHAEPNPVFSG